MGRNRPYEAPITQPVVEETPIITDPVVEPTGTEEDTTTPEDTTDDTVNTEDVAETESNEDGSVETTTGEEESKEEVSSTEDMDSATLPEVTPEEVNTQPEVVVVPLAAKVYNVEDIRAILSDGELSVEDKLKAIGSFGRPDFEVLVIGLVKYVNTMGKDSVFTNDKSMALNNYNLFNVIRKALEDKDYDTFSLKFTIINMVFNHFKDDAYKVVNMHRFHYAWQWGAESLKAYQYLVTTISTLCNIETRKAALETININRAFSKEETSLNDTAIENLKRYYL